MLTHNKL